MMSRMAARIAAISPRLRLVGHALLTEPCIMHFPQRPCPGRCAQEFLREIVPLGFGDVAAQALADLVDGLAQRRDGDRATRQHHREGSCQAHAQFRPS